VVFLCCSEEQRVKNLAWDMTHYHAMERHGKVEMSLEVSALLRKRPGETMADETQLELFARCLPTSLL
jgi:hypothetical protein